MWNNTKRTGKTRNNGKYPNREIIHISGNTNKWKRSRWKSAKINNTKKIDEKLKNIENDLLKGIKTIQRINFKVISMLRYSFGIVNYSNTLLDKIDKKTTGSINRMKLKRSGTTKWRYYLSYKYLGLNLQSAKIEYLISLLKMKKSLAKSNGIRKVYKIYDENIKPSKKC